MAEDEGFDLHFCPKGKNKCSHQFLNWWQQLSTGQLRCYWFEFPAEASIKNCLAPTPFRVHSQGNGFSHGLKIAHPQFLHQCAHWCRPFESLISAKENSEHHLVFAIFWQRMRDSNPRKRSQSPVCYRYTNPLSHGRNLLYAKYRKSQALFSILAYFSVLSVSSISC